MTGSPPFELLETMRWTPGAGFWLLDRHLDRLRRSAEHFGFRYAAERVEAVLAPVSATSMLRVRLLVGSDGAARIESSPLTLSDAPIRVALAESAIDPGNEFLYHKTTNRTAYEQARRPGVDDVILWNVIGEITESTIANIVVDIAGRRVTPPVPSGLLPGTFRAELLERAEIEERIILVDQLRAVRRFWLVNSVRGWCDGVLTS
jgi:para-aminobenzoate synthetase/4-amino-4-deoxychorismate lyase